MPARWTISPDGVEDATNDPSRVDQSTLDALLRAEHGDPFGTLGMHRAGTTLVLRALLPGALWTRLLALAALLVAGCATGPVSGPAGDGAHAPVARPVPLITAPRQDVDRDGPGLHPPSVGVLGDQPPSGNPYLQDQTGKIVA